MRINRYFTDRGLCSRREADRWIDAGRVSINGRLAKLGDQVEDGDEVTLDGKSVGAKSPRKVVIAYHKAVGIECTSDPKVENNIIDAVAYPERLFHIGRLDKMSEGLILLTNVGDLVNAILRPAHKHPKEYIVAYNAPVLDEVITAFKRGVELDDGRTEPARVERLGTNRLRLVLTEGRNRQIRRMAEAVGLRVVRLKRVRVLNIELGSLPKGKWRELSAEELSELGVLTGLRFDS